MSQWVRRIFYQLHLWLGMLSGIVVVNVCLTGCMYVFKEEITNLTQPWRFVTPQDRSMLLPSKVLEVASYEFPNKVPASITYGETFDALMVDYYETNSSSTLFINPYDPLIVKKIHKSSNEFDFFRFILHGHRRLWLPDAIGKIVVGYGVLLFMITLFTGIFLWWPKQWNRKSLKRNFTFSRRNPIYLRMYDLHNVLGGYVFIFLFILSFTGSIWSLDWFGKSVYYLTSGGKELKPYIVPVVETSSPFNHPLSRLDELYIKLRMDQPAAKTFYFALPSQANEVIRVSIVHERGSFFKTDNLFFNPYTLQPVEGQGPYAGKYSQVSLADQIRRINLEIHDGRIGGIGGKILAFAVSLIGASLPITGFMLWFRRKKRKLI